MYHLAGMGDCALSLSRQFPVALSNEEREKIRNGVLIRPFSAIFHQVRV